MFGWLKDFINNLVDEFWPELDDWIKYKLSLKIFKPVIEEDVEPEYNYCILIPYYKFKAWFLYTTFPCQYIFYYINLIYLKQNKYH